MLIDLTHTNSFIMGARSSTQQPVRSLDSFLYASKNKSRQEVLDERDDGSNLMFSPPKIHRGLQNFGENIVTGV